MPAIVVSRQSKLWPPSENETNTALLPPSPLSSDRFSIQPQKNHFYQGVTPGVCHVGRSPSPSTAARRNNQKTLNIIIFDWYYMLSLCLDAGSSDLQCDNSGRCRCKQGVMGEKCDQCQPNYFNFGPEGCQYADLVYIASIEIVSLSLTSLLWLA